eukprot:6524815-Pyramimonas_sp.AAC.1
MAEVAHARGWKVMGRAVRGVMLEVGGSHEVHDMHRVADALRDMEAALAEPHPSQLLPEAGV